MSKKVKIAAAIGSQLAAIIIGYLAYETLISPEVSFDFLKNAEENGFFGKTENTIFCLVLFFAPVVQKFFMIN
jgi:hypothetical protein